MAAPSAQTLQRLAQDTGHQPGLRGQPPADLDALAAALSRLSLFAAANAGTHREPRPQPLPLPPLRRPRPRRRPRSPPPHPVAHAAPPVSPPPLICKGLLHILPPAHRPGKRNRRMNVCSIEHDGPESPARITAPSAPDMKATFHHLYPHPELRHLGEPGALTELGPDDR